MHFQAPLSSRPCFSLSVLMLSFSHLLLVDVLPSCIFTSVLPHSGLHFSLSPPSHIPILFPSRSVSFSASAFPVIHVGGKRISRRKRGSKALNDDTEFWLNKFRPLTPSEKLSYSSSKYNILMLLLPFGN